jgi:hypothetical protein
VFVFELADVISDDCRFGCYAWRTAENQEAAVFVDAAALRARSGETRWLYSFPRLTFLALPVTAKQRKNS